MFVMMVRRSKILLNSRLFFRKEWLLVTGFFLLSSGVFPAGAQLPDFQVPDELNQAPGTGSPAAEEQKQTPDPQSLLPVAGQDKKPGSDLPVAGTEDNPDMALNPFEASSNPGFTLDTNSKDAAASPVSKEEREAEKRKEAFNAALKGLLPLSPEEIREMLEQFDRTQESVELPVYPAPKPEVAVETVSLDPGSQPVVVKVAYGNVTTLSMLDASGAPWPIEDVSWAGNFEIADSASSKTGAHILRITPQSEFATGNISLRMLTLKTPVIIALETSRDIVHYRFDAIVPEYGPLAETPLIDQGISIKAGDTNISSVLQGVIPKEAKKLTVSGLDGRTTAYDYKGQTFIRTPLSLLSPSWSSSVASADGTRVYAIKKSPVILLSDNGKMVRARLSARENLLEDASDEQ